MNLWIIYEFENKEEIILYTACTNWTLQLEWKFFCKVGTGFLEHYLKLFKFFKQ
jgi:hypothetical protein